MSFSCIPSVGFFFRLVWRARLPSSSSDIPLEPIDDPRLRPRLLTRETREWRLRTDTEGGSGVDMSVSDSMSLVSDSVRKDSE